MSQVSKYRLSEKVNQEIKSLFVEILSMLSGKEDVSAFLEDFLTPTERIVLAKRITIAFMLKKGYDYEIIKSILKVSQSTVSAINLKLKYSGKGYHKILDKILLQERIKASFDQIENFLLKTLSMGRGKGTGFWKELKKRKKFDDSNHRTL